MPELTEEEKTSIFDTAPTVSPTPDDIGKVFDRTGYEAIDNDNIAVEYNDLSGMTEKEALMFAGAMGAQDTYRGLFQMAERNEEAMKRDQKKLNAILRNKDYGGKALAAYAGGLIVDPAGWIIPIKKAKSMAELVGHGIAWGGTFGFAGYVDEDGGLNRVEQAGITAVGGGVLSGAIGLAGAKKLGFGVNPKITKEMLHADADELYRIKDIDEVQLREIKEGIELTALDKASVKNLKSHVDLLAGEKTAFGTPKGENIIDSYNRYYTRPMFENMKKNPLAYALGGIAAVGTYKYVEESTTASQFIGNAFLTTMAFLTGKKLAKNKYWDWDESKYGRELMRQIYPKAVQDKTFLQGDYAHLRGVPAVYRTKFRDIIQQVETKLSPDEQKAFFNLFIGDLNADELIKISKGQKVYTKKIIKPKDAKKEKITKVPLDEYLGIKELPLSKNIETIINLNEKGRKVMNELGADLVHSGILDGDEYLTFMNSYLHRSYLPVLKSKGAKAAEKFRTNLGEIKGEGLKHRGHTKFYRDEVSMAKYIKSQEKLNRMDNQIKNAYGQKYTKEMEAKSPTFRFTEEGKIGKYINRVQEGDPRYIKGKKDLDQPSNWGITIKKDPYGKGTYGVTTQMTKEMRQAMAEIEDLAYNLQKTMEVTLTDAGLGSFYKFIATNPSYKGSKVLSRTQYREIRKSEGASRKQIDEDMHSDEVIINGKTFAHVANQKVKDTTVAKKYGMLSDKFVEEEVFNNIKAIHGVKDIVNNVVGHDTKGYKAGQAYMTGLKLWKETKTTLNPVVHSNNFLSNVPNYFLAAGFTKNSVHQLAKGFSDIPYMLKHMRGEIAYEDLPKNMQTMIKQGVFDPDFVSQELLQSIDVDEIAKIYKFNPKDFESVSGWTDLGAAISNKTKAYLTSNESLVTKIRDFAKQWYQIEDRIFRYALFNERKSIGYSDFAASHDAIRFFVDYNIRSPLINSIRHSLVPFLSYSYGMLPNMIEHTITRPDRLAAIGAAFWLMNDASTKWVESSRNLEEAERELMPEFRQKTMFSLPFMPYANVRLPYDGRNGGAKYIDWSRKLPAGDVFAMGGDTPTAVPSWPAFLQPGGPALEFATKVLGGRDGWSGQPYNKVNDGVIYRLGEFAKGFVPNIPFPYSDTPSTNRLRRAFKSEQPSLKDPLSPTEAFFNSVIGTVNTADIGRLTTIKGKAKARIIKEHTDARKQARKDFADGKLTDIELFERIKEIEEELSKIIHEEHRINKKHFFEKISDEVFGD